MSFLKSGDKISWRQYQAGAVGGIGISFSDGTNPNWNTKDTNGETMNSDGTQNQWDYRTVDLSSFAGKTAVNLWVPADAGTPVGSWNGYFSDIAVYSTDGTVIPIYARQASEGLSYFSGGGETNTQAFVERSNTAGDAEQPANTTTYYLNDQIGSARTLTAGGGWPVSQDVYYPYGVEPHPPADANHYKFAGLERDAETGLDHAWFRQYGARWAAGCHPTRITAATTSPIPRASIDMPMSTAIRSLMSIPPGCTWRLSVDVFLMWRIRLSLPAGLQRIQGRQATCQLPVLDRVELEE